MKFEALEDRKVLAGFLAGAYVPDADNFFEDESREAYLDVNGDNTFGVGDVLLGFARMDDHTAPAGAFGALGNRVYAVFSQQVADINATASTHEVIFKPTTVAGLKLSDLFPGLGIPAEGMVAAFDSTTPLPIDLINTSPGDITTGPPGGVATYPGGPPNGTINMWDYLAEIQNNGSLSFVAGIGNVGGAVATTVGDTPLTLAALSVLPDHFIARTTPIGSLLITTPGAISNLPTLGVGVNVASFEAGLSVVLNNEPSVVYATLVQATETASLPGVFHDAAIVGGTAIGSAGAINRAEWDNTNPDSAFSNPGGFRDDADFLVHPTRPRPQIDIEKTTDGPSNTNPTDSDFDNEDISDGLGVPVLTPGTGVTWTYNVTNTGTVTIPLADITVTDSVPGVTPTLVIDANSADSLLSPGEMWFYTASGGVLDLAGPLPVGVTVVPGCNPNDVPGQDRQTYVNVGTVTIPTDTDNDPSHYCNPEPQIDIEKTTDGPSNTNPTDSDFDNEDISDGLGVPVLTPGTGVTWTYKVTNTGTVTIPLADITVTDSVPGVTPTLVIDANSADSLLSPGEMWFYTASGGVLDLAGPLPVGVTVVPGCNPNDVPGQDRQTYVNVGTVTIPTDTDNDPSHYCNPEPQIDIEKTTDGPSNTNPTDSDFDNEDISDGLGVPVLTPGTGVTWTYKVTNTGTVTIPLADITVTDSVPGVTPTLVIDANSADSLLSPGEMWFYTASGGVLDLAGPLPVGVTVVPGCNPNDVPGQDRQTYVNVGTVTIPTDTDNDPSHYCNQRDPGIDIEKTTNGPTNSNPTAPDFDNEDAENGPGVPLLTPGSTVTWTYKVTNTGDVPFAFNDVVIVDDNGTPGNLADDLSTTGGQITFDSVMVGDADNILEPGEMWLYEASGIVQDLSTPAGPSGTFDLSGNSGTDGADGNIRTFTDGSLSVKVSGFSREKASGDWSSAFLGAYSGGVGVTDSSEGDGSSNRHTVDNLDLRDNYVLFEFSQSVVVDSAFLGFVVNDSDLTYWIGTLADPFNNHVTLSDAVLSGLGFTEVNLTDLATTRTADLNAGNISGNVLVIAALIGDETPEDKFKIETLTVSQPQEGCYENKAVVTAPGDDDSDLSHYCNPPDNPDIDIEKYVKAVPQPCEGEGLTPGFWKTHSEYGPAPLKGWPGTGYDPDDSYEAVFGVNVPGSPSLLDALGASGGGLNALLRHSAAALLNASHPNIEYDYTEAQVIALTQAAINSGDADQIEDLKDEFDELNNQGADLTNSGNCSNGDGQNADADTPADAIVVHVGDTIMFTYVVTNPGDVGLSPVVLTDDGGNGPEFNPTYVSGDDGDDILEPGEEWIYTAMGIVTGSDCNVATVIGTNVNPPHQNVIDADPACWETDFPEPEIKIEKFTNGHAAQNEGDPDVPQIAPSQTVTWTYKVTNTGHLPFASNEIVVVDDNGTPGNSADDMSTTDGDITFQGVLVGDADNILEPGEMWLYQASGIAQDLPDSVSGSTSTIDMSGNSSVTGSAGNIRTFTTGSVSVKASGFSRDSAGTWDTAYLGSYGGGLGVTDGSEGGSSDTHTVDNVGRKNYVLFEFNQSVIVDSAFLGYVVNDSDLTVWIGTKADPFNNHQTLSDAFLTGLGFTETNLTGLATTRTADLNAGNLAGNVLVIAADVDDVDPEDRFKIELLKVKQPGQGGCYENKAVVTVPGDTDSDLSHYCNPDSPPEGSISGHKYKDKTGNGPSNDDVNHPLSGVTIYVDADNDGELDANEPRDTTNSNGFYRISDLAPGTYKVREVVPTGYIRTGPVMDDYRTVTVVASQDTSVDTNSDEIDFYNFKKCDTSSITHISYKRNGTTTIYDLSGNVQQGDQITVKFYVTSTVEASLVSYTAPDPFFDADRASMQVVFDSATGTFSPGWRSLTVDVPDSYFQIDFVCGPIIDRLGPAGSNIFYTPQMRLIDAHNGGTNAPVANASSLAGFVYLDKDNDGIKDGGENGIGGVSVKLYNANNAVIRTEATRPDGSYIFSNLSPATYKIKETQPSAYNDGKDKIGTPGGTTTNDTFYSIALPGNFHGANNNFGERPKYLVAQGAEGSDENTGSLGGVVTGELLVSIQNADGAIDDDQMARIRDAISSINNSLESLGVTLTEVSVDSEAPADIQLQVADTSECGGIAEGVLGCAAGSQITILKGWGWYSAADAGGIAPTQYDFQSIVTHELGHGVGLGHSQDSESAMYSALPAGAVRRRLTDGDIASIGQFQEQDDEPEALFAAPFLGERGNPIRIQENRRERLHAARRGTIEVPSSWQDVRQAMTVIRRGGHAATVGTEIHDAALQAVLSESPSVRPTIEGSRRAARSRSVDRDALEVEFSQPL